MRGKGWGGCEDGRAQICAPHAATLSPALDCRSLTEFKASPDALIRSTAFAASWRDVEPTMNRGRKRWACDLCVVTYWRYPVSEKPSRKRKPAATLPSKPVKCTILLDVETHTKLAAAAAMRRCDRSTYAAEILREGLRGIVCFDRFASGKTADHVDPTDSEDRATAA